MDQVGRCTTHHGDDWPGRMWTWQMQGEKTRRVVQWKEQKQKNGGSDELVEK